MAWTGLTLNELEELIACGLATIDEQTLETWNSIRIPPEKWQCSPWGDSGGGFWVVAEINGYVLWYNDIEEGFNTSRFTVRGTIDEYSCDQTTFEEFIQRLEAQSAESWDEGLAAQVIPTVLQNGGVIVRRQTTYWTIQSLCGSRWRMHFKSKAETRFLNPQFAKMEFVESHPLLEQYNEPWADLYFNGVPNSPAELLTRLAEQVSTATSGWRSIKEYLNQSANLQKGYGLLMEAPVSIVEKASALLNELGLKTSILKTMRRETHYRAVIMSENAVVAQSFRFEAEQIDDVGQ